MSRWFRHYAGMMSDPKFGGVARFCKRSRAEVLFVWGCLLESASEYDSAVYSWDADAMAELLGIETEQAQAIHDGLVSKGLLADGRIASWDKRQFTSDDSTARVKDWRKRRKEAAEAERLANETLQTVTVTPSETEAEPEEGEASLPAATVVAAVRAARKPKPEKPKAKPPAWLTDPDFCAAWDACTDKMRKRSESREKTYPHWQRSAEKAGGAGALLHALRAYLRNDDDLKRTGGPGFHVWLSEGRWDHWIGSVGAIAMLKATWTGPPAIRNAVINETNSDFAGSYLDPCAWQDGALVPRTAYAADKLRRLRSLKDVPIREPRGVAA